jgi:hypothetical protein
VLCHWACVWQLQDAPADYHLSLGRGQGRLRRCEGVLWAFNVENFEIAKTCVAGLAHLGLDHAHYQRYTPTT